MSQSERLGLSKGGFPTKIRFRSNVAGFPMRTGITLGQTKECLGFHPAMDSKMPEPSVLPAEEVYDANSNRVAMRE